MLPYLTWKLTQASLCNILQHVGFTSVFDCRIPLVYLYAGEEREFKIWGNRITLAAIKGQPLDLPRGSGTPAELQRDWPENLKGYLFERYIVKRQTWAERWAGRLDLVRGFLRKKFQR